MVSSLDPDGAADGLKRCSFTHGDKLTGRKYDEAWIQRLVATHPELFPIAPIEPALAGATTVCIELRTLAGFVDNLLATDRGDLVIVECKLWRNPQAANPGCTGHSPGQRNVKSAADCVHPNGGDASGAA